MQPVRYSGIQQGIQEGIQRERLIVESMLQVIYDW
jgi:hypothetical protein